MTRLKYRREKELSHPIVILLEGYPYPPVFPRLSPAVLSNVFPLMPKVKEELKRMEDTGIIEKVTEPTDWCSPIVVVPKATGAVRICVDLFDG